jgi:Uma2 family endonuclease
MATDLLSQTQVPQALPPELYPDVEHLVTEDDTPVDNIFSEKQQRLLTEPLYSSPEWAQGGNYIALANVGVFYAIRQPPYVPDMLVSLGVELPEDLWPKGHRCYMVWEYGKPPDVIVEIVSNDEGDEDPGKIAGYAKIGVRYYVIYDPLRILSAQSLRGFELSATGYRPLSDLSFMPGMGLGLREWEGRYEDHTNTWLRWVDANGELVPTGAERAQRLAEQLRRLGIEPEV